jgi:hypothetical protein
VFGGYTNTTGRYNLIGLRVGGPYTVTVSMVGKEEQVKTGLRLSLNQNLTVNFLLPEKVATSEEIIVYGDKNPIISKQRTGASQLVNQVAIENLPTISRSIHDFSRTSPLITSSGTGSNVSGRNSKFNNIQLDGTVMNDPFGLSGTGTPGGLAGAEPISLDAIEEFQVSIAPFDVRQGMFTGGLINSITRSGSNLFAGSAYYYGRNEALVGLSPDKNETEYPDFSEYQFGARIGGPILKDKLFFFVSGEVKSRIDPQPLSINDPNSANNFAVSAADLDRIKQIAENRYGYKPGSYGEYERPTDDTKLFMRLDYNINPSHRLTLRHNYVSATQGNDVRRDAYSLSFDGQEALFDHTQNQTVAQLNSLFGKNMANEFRVAFTSLRDTRNPQADLFPNVRIKNLGDDGRRSVYMGVGQYSQANSVDQNVIEFTDNFNYFLGNHVFTLGTHNQIVSFDNVFIRDFYGNYEFASIDDFEKGTPSYYSHSYGRIDGNREPHAEFTYASMGVYLQDEWSVFSNLRFTFGVRADIFSFMDAPLENPEFAAAFPGYKTSEMPTPVAFSPRLGFNYDVMNDSKTQIRGGIGVFAGSTPGVWLANQYSNTGMDMTRLSIYKEGEVPDFNPDINEQYEPAPKAATSEINITDPDFKMPQILRTNIAVDREIAWGIIGTAEFVYGKSINDVLFQDLNSKYSGETLADGRKLYSNEKVSDKFTNVILMTNTDEGTQMYMTLQLQKPFGKGMLSNFDANIAYTYSEVKDINSTPSTQAMSNWRYNYTDDPNNPSLSTSSFDIPHRFLANLSYQFKYLKQFRTTLGVFYEGRSGSPFSFVYKGNPNNDRAYRDNDLAYIPEYQDDKVILTSGNWDELEEFLSSVDGIGDCRGKIAERNSFRTPWVNTLDFRLTQDIPTYKNQKLTLSLDVLNLFSLFGSEAGYQKNVAYNNYQLLNYDGIDEETGKMKIGFNPTKNNEVEDIYYTNDLWSRWQIQIGLRYSF